MNYWFKKNRWGKALFVSVALLLGSCAALPSAAASSPALSSPSVSTSGRTYQDRIMNAYIADGNDSNGLAYFKSDTANMDGTFNVCVSLGTCTSASITIPNTWNSNPVVGIKEQGFAGDNTLTSITLPTASTFTWIGSEAFADTNMTTLNIPASVTTINPSAFFNCANLAYLYFSSGSVLTTIDEYAFANCGLLTQCRLPASLVTIGAAAFQGDYSIVRMVLPKNLTTIGAGAFIDCTQMNLTYFPHKVTTVGAYAFKGCYNTQAYFSDSDASGQTAFATNWDYVGASYTLNSGSALLKKNYNKPNLNYNSDYIYIQADPSITASNYDVNIIAYVGTDNSATAGSVNLDASGRGVVPATIVDVDDSTIQHKVIGINSYAFQNHTELGNVVFGSSSAPSNIKTISAYAFQGCDNLKVLDFNYASSLETIGAHAFEHSSTTSNITVSSLYIPASVTDIGAYAFTDFTKLTSLVFQDEASTTLYSHLTSIGDHAFLNAGSASYTANSPATFTLTLPCNYLANIWNNAFENARFISDLVFSSTKTNSALADSAVASLYIRSSAFYNCYSLANVTFSSHVTRLGNNAFQIDGLNASNWPGVKSFYLPSTITTIDGNSTFYGQNRATIYCAPATRPSTWNSGNRINNTELTVGLYHNDDYANHNQLPIYYNVGNAVGQRHLIHSVDATNGTFDFLTVADSTGALTTSTAICSRFYYAGSHSTTYTPKVPATISATYNSVNVTYTINGVGQAAFYYSTSGNTTSITKVTLPSAIASFDDVAFTNCKYLVEVSSYSGTTSYQYRLPQSLTTIGAYMFAHDPLVTLVIPSTLTSIGSTIFEGCTKLTSLTMINSSGTTVENGTAYSCISNMIYIGATPTELNTGALGATMDSTNTLAIADGVTKIDSYALHSDVGIKHITAPATMTTIDAYSVRDVDSLLSFRFRSGADGALTPALTIGNYAFDNCNKITTMEMPARLTSIGDIAFWGNFALKHFPTTSTQTVDDTSTDGVLDLSACTNLSYIGTQAFEQCTSIKSVTLPDTTKLTTLNGSAFIKCTGLTTVNLGNHLTSLGGSCFSGCTALTSVNTGTAMKTLSDNAFNGDTSLTSLTLGSAVTSIGGSCFLNTKLASLTLPTSVTSIGGSAFNGNSAMTSITFGDGTSSSIIGRSGTLTINNGAFANCTNSSLSKIVIPDNAKFNAPGTDYVFAKDSQLTIYLGCTLANFTTTNYPTGWNYRDNSLTSTALPYKLYSATQPTDTSYSYWHYVGTTPTAW